MTWVFGHELAHRTMPESGVLVINNQYDPDVLDQLLKDRSDVWVVSDCYDITPPSQVPVITMPLNLAWWWDPQRRGRGLDQFRLHASYPTQQAANFMMFKPNQVSLMMLKIMRYLGINTESYVCNITELNQIDAAVIKYHGGDDNINEFLAWANLEWSPDIQPKCHGDRRNSDHWFQDHWNRFLQDQVFGPTAVALISERSGVGTWDSMHFTEKSLYPMLGCNFPIWIGGLSQARLWQQRGFDIFDDVVNHSYQDRGHWLERVFYALFDNRMLLTDVDHARDMRCWHWRRLADNRQRVLDNVLGQHIRDQAQQHPLSVQLYKYVTSVGYSDRPW